jgi:hypothetical protein
LWLGNTCWWKVRSESASAVGPVRETSDKTGHVDVGCLLPRTYTSRQDVEAIGLWKIRPDWSAAEA